jgi:hypothetical protein
VVHPEIFFGIYGKFFGDDLHHPPPQILEASYAPVIQLFLCIAL